MSIGCNFPNKIRKISKKIDDQKRSKCTNNIFKKKKKLKNNISVLTLDFLVRPSLSHKPTNGFFNFFLFFTFCLKKN